MKTLATHEAAAIFPLMEQEAFDALKQDIATHGQKTPIILTEDEKILDGRHRYKACQELGIEPVISTERFHVNGQTCQDFVLSANLHRRHLSTSERACVAALVAEQIFMPEASSRKHLNCKKGTGHGSSSQRAGKLLNVSPALVYHAQTVKRKDPETFEKCQKGLQKVGNAYAHILHQEKATRVALTETLEIPKIFDPYEKFMNFDRQMGLRGLVYHYTRNEKLQHFGIYLPVGTIPLQWTPKDACTDFRQAMVLAAKEILKL